MQAKVTGQHPLYKSVYSTLYDNQRYNINIESGKVWQHVCMGSTYRNRDVTSSKIIAAVKLAVLKHIGAK